MGETTGNKIKLVLRLLEFPEESHRLLNERKIKAESSNSSVDEMEEQYGDGGAKKQSEQKKIANKLCVEKARE